MIAACIWYLLIELIGLAALPVTARLLRFLPGRGVVLAKQVGLLLTGYAFWLLASLHAAEISGSLAWACIVALALAALALLWRERAQLRAAWSERRGLWLAGEAVFAVAYVAFAVFRAYNPEIAATEKPMELAFINGILRSAHFPPQDPWLAGYAISYYYGGYALTAMLTLASGLRSAVTFNLTNVTLFALTASGAFGLVAELVLVREQHVGARPERAQRRALWAGLVGAVLLGVMGNLEGAFELLRAHGGGSEALWRWLDVRNLGATAVSTHWYPDDGWWWWRASRIIHDRDALGNAMEVISEFPFFSFLLGDNHPHVYALPFGLLTLALALNVWRVPAPTGVTNERGGWAQRLADTLLPGVTPLDWLAWAVLLGALGLYNTWDLPVQLLVFVIAVALCLWRRRPAVSDWLPQVISVGATLALGCILLYLPFYWGLRTQAGGLGLVPVKTQWQQVGLMFGALLWPLWGAGGLGLWRTRWRGGMPLGRVMALLLAGLAFCMALLGWWTACLGLALAAVAAYLLLARDTVSGAAPDSDGFVALLTLGGALLIVVVEFVYLVDVFDSRMNTVFKFYYQAWLLLAIAAAYALYRLAGARGRGLWRLLRGLWLALSAVLIAAGLSYTVAAATSKADGFRGMPTLDGERYLAEERPAEYEALRWLDAHAREGAVLVEATGGSYTEYAWVSAHTGIPTLLGWGGHELQWRGNYDVPGQREPVIAAFYQTTDPAALRALAAQYDVDYVWLGPLERRSYALTPPAEQALDRAFVQLFANDAVVIYGTHRE